jgi:hypothetical protein
MCLCSSAALLTRDRAPLALALIGLLLVALALPYDAMALLLGLAAPKRVGGSPFTPVPKDGVLVLSVALSRGGNLADNRVNQLDVTLQASALVHACPTNTNCYTIAYVMYRDGVQGPNGRTSAAITTAASTVSFGFAQFRQDSYLNISVTITLARQA